MRVLETFFSSPRLRVVAIGAATGAVASTGAVALFALLTGKALAAATLAKPVAGLPTVAGVQPAASAKGLLNLLLPGAVGAVGGGAAGAGLARRQVSQVLGPLRKEVGDLARQVLRAADAPDAGGAAPGPGGAPTDNPAPGTGTAPDRAAIRELERIRGIGPHYAALLVAGGLRSLADLAHADPAHIRELLDASVAAPMAAPA